MKTTLHERFKIEDLTCDGKCQQRPLSQEVVDHYAALMKEKVKFPPVECVQDGEKTWVWDGFHRIAARKKCGHKNIAANVGLGSLKHAVFLSCGANATHGLRRSHGEVQYVVKKMLADSEMAKMSNKEIALHVGCSQQFVGRLRKGEEKPKDKTPTPEAPMEDGEGKKIPQKLAENWLLKSVVEKRIREVDGIKNSVENCDNDTYALLNKSGFKATILKIRDYFTNALFYAVCPQCKGKGCELCKGCGFINEATWRMVPKKSK